MAPLRSIDLRGLFDNIRVDWRDRGANTSRGNVNICCPFCGDDLGFHLTISEERGGLFYCYRRPQEHSGSNFVRVLVRLGLSRTEAVSLINNFLGKVGELSERPEEIAVSKMEKRWSFFEPAVESDRALDYLEKKRGFSDPERVARAYDLRVAPVGAWAQRLLFPMRNPDGELEGWTGRAFRNDMQPRYFTEHGNREGTIYLPRAGRWCMIACEGPMDALKGAAATEDLPISLVAMTGKQLNLPRLWKLAQACSRSARIYLAVDSDAGIGERSRMLAELRGACPYADLIMFTRIPKPFKDLGEMPEAAASDWLAGLAS